MPTDCKNIRSIDFLSSWQENSNYFEMLQLMSSLSKLFSENDTPYLDYRLAENLFCKYFNAINDARSCTAYDARIEHLGIGIKTFIINKDSSVEKIAEFNKLKPTLENLQGKYLATKLAEYRNMRINFANNTYDVNESIYHIVGRKAGELVIFNTPYEEIDINNIRDIEEKEASLSFNDGKNFYSFNKSKSVLMKRFDKPELTKIIPVEIFEDPFKILSDLIIKTSNTESLKKTNLKIKGIDYVVLPLYSTRGGIHVPERSGLNQWNAQGRKRNENEVYIPIPKEIHKNYPDFFPDRDTSFDLILPNGNVLSASICQENGKALMSNPNSALGEWILRKALNKNIGELVTMEDLTRYGIDSVLIEKFKDEENNTYKYQLRFSELSYEGYEDFIAK